MRTIIFVFLLSGPLIFSQEVIQLKNPSFEGIPQCCQPPLHWRDCGFQNETPPDVQPSGSFNVIKQPYDGDTYLGMVTRANDTWERVSQELGNPILKGKSYCFNIYLCRSSNYLSPSKENPGQSVPFTDPIILRIWGAQDPCKPLELLDQSEPVENMDWKEFHFQFHPKQTFQYIILEAYYKKPTVFPYRGNILIDKASDIQECHPD